MNDRTEHDRPKLDRPKLDRPKLDRPKLDRKWCELEGQHILCPLVHDDAGIGLNARDVGADYFTWIQALSAHEAASLVAHGVRMDERRRERQEDWRRMSTRQRAQYRRRARERFEAVLVDGHERERAEAEAEGWSHAAWRFFLAMDELDVRLFVAVHGPRYSTFDTRRRCPIFDDENVLRDLCERAVAEDPGLVEMIRTRTREAESRQVAAWRLERQTAPAGGVRPWSEGELERMLTLGTVREVSEEATRRMAVSRA